MFFIVGRGRSGALLLSRMLMRHPQLVVVPEGGFLLNLYGKYGRYHRGHWNRRRIEAFCRDLLAEDRMRAWGFDVERLKRSLHEREEALTYASACQLVYAAYARDVLGLSPKWVGDRNAQHALHLGALDRIFPHARYLHITRDYRDNIRSYRDAALDLGNPAALALRWMRYNQEILRLSRKAPERFLWLRYEDLCAHPQHTLSRVQKFLELDGDDASAAARDVLGDGPQRYWEHELPASVIEQADAVCGSFAERFGYQPSSYRQSSRSGYAQPLLVQGGRLLGEASMMAEKLAFRALSVRARIALSNACDRFARGGPAAVSEAHSR
jgi:hypothetical protein